MKRILLICCLAVQNFCVVAVLHELEDLSAQLKLLAEIKFPVVPVPSILPTVPGCAKSLLGLSENDYDLLLVNARYEPFRAFLDGFTSVGMYDSIIAPALKPALKPELEASELPDSLYQEFYYLTKSKKQASAKQEYEMQQIVIFGCPLEKMYDADILAGAMYPLKPLEEMPVWNDKTQEEIKKELAQESNTTVDAISDLYARNVFERRSAAIAARNEPIEEFNLRNTLRTNMFKQRRSHEQAQIFFKSTAGLFLRVHFFEYLMNWLKFSLQEKELAGTIKKIASERGLKIENNYAVLSRRVYWIHNLKENVIERALRTTPIKGLYFGTDEVVQDVFSLWLGGLPIQRLQWRNSGVPGIDKLVSKKNLNIILDPAITQEEIYSLIINKHKKIAQLDTPHTSDCLVLELTNDDNWRKNLPSNS